MPVLYKLHKDTRQYLRKEKGTSGQSGYKPAVDNPSYKKWFAKSVHTGVVTTDQVAELVQENCSMKKSDVKAVIEELISVIRSQILDSRIVKLDGLGQFKVGLKTKPADTVDDFNVVTNIIGSHVLFLPACTVDTTNKDRDAALLRGIKVQEAPKNPII